MSVIVSYCSEHGKNKEFLSQDEIGEILKRDTSMQDKARMLCSAALEHGSEDDRSVIIMRTEDDPERAG